jgi:hypothetical protein
MSDQIEDNVDTPDTIEKLRASLLDVIEAAEAAGCRNLPAMQAARDLHVATATAGAAAEAVGEVVGPISVGTGTRGTSVRWYGTPPAGGLKLYTDPPPTGRAQVVRRAHLAAATAEVERLKGVNRDLHRRMQKVEGPALSYEQRVAYLSTSMGKQWLFEFNRLMSSFGEIQRIFLEVARIYEYPMGGNSRHSVSDSNVEQRTGIGEGVFANCFLSSKGGMKSFRVLDEVRHAVDEVLRLRGIGGIERAAGSSGPGSTQTSACRDPVETGVVDTVDSADCAVSAASASHVKS